MGKAALEGHKGIKSVTSGWRGFREINTVHYDPAAITIAEMVRVLKDAGTYMETIKGDQGD